MIDRDGIERPDDPHAHMQQNSIAPRDRDIDENYNFINRNIFFRMFSAFFTRLGIWILGPWVNRHYKLQILGKENLKLVKKQGVMVTLNHVHNFDNVVVGSRLLRHRKCYFITLKDNINMPFVGFLLRALGGIPLPSDFHAVPAFEQSISTLLAKKKAILICPEASLWPYYRGVRPFKKGAFKYAVNNNAPILPIVFSFRRKLKKRQAKKGKEKYKYYFTVQIGKPLRADPNLKGRKAIADLCDRTYNFYKETMDSFYEQEDKFEQQAREKLISKSKKVAKNLPLYPKSYPQKEEQKED